MDNEKSVQKLLLEFFPDHPGIKENVQSYASKIYGAVRKKVLENEAKKMQYEKEQLQTQIRHYDKERMQISSELRALNKKQSDAKMILDAFSKVKKDAMELKEELLCSDISRRRAAYIRGYLACYDFIMKNEKNLPSPPQEILFMPKFKTND